MKHIKRFVTILLVTFALLVLLTLAAPTAIVSYAEDGIIFVDIDATGANNGTSWADAFTSLQPALEAAISGNEIWVAEGIYRPTVMHGGTEERSKSFQLKYGVAIYGGFDGTESSLEQRDWVANKTILSGDLNGDDGPDFANNAENSYHVFYHDSSVTVSNSILDGFTISGGNANGSPQPMGGGMYNSWSNPRLNNCVFTGNYASSYGGGMYNASSSPVLTNCIFSGNKASTGGGIHNEWGSNVRLTNCVFWENTGAGITNIDNPGLIITNSIFWGNIGQIVNIIIWDEYQITVMYSDIQGGYVGDSNIDADPQFMEPSSGDFHLSPGSPCIESGYNYADYLPLYDFEGDARILDGNGDGYAVVDMGVDEFSQSTLTVEISIQPDGHPSTVRCTNDRTIIEVAILTTNTFNALAVDHASVSFETATEFHIDKKTNEPKRHEEDIDGDGDLDLLFHFHYGDTSLTCESIEGTLVGETFEGTPIEGTAFIEMRE